MKENKPYGIIYKATGPDGKVYIGQTTKTLAQRKADHAYRAKKNDKRTHFQIAILEHGGVNSFQWDEIDQANTAAELNAKEKQWIAYCKANDLRYGYNITEGGQNPKHTEETRKKIGDAHKGKPSKMRGKNLSEEIRRKYSEIKKGEKNNFYGKRHTEETKRKMSEAHKNISPETRRKMSEAHKGINTWTKGKKLSAETKCRMSEVKRGVNTKISVEIVRLIKIDLWAGMKPRHISQKYEVPKQIVYRIKYGKTWAWLKVS